jgi:hypothetical protein
MDRLDESTGSLIANNLLCERDLASLACTCRFWRIVLSPDNAALWNALLCKRFGQEAAAAQPGAAPPAVLYRRLASHIQPVAQLEKIVWLNGNYLQRIPEADSTFGEVIRVREVCWLELAGRFRGVLPASYRVVWRVRVEVGAALWHASQASWHAL